MAAARRTLGVDVASHGVRSVIVEDARPLAVGRATFPEPAPPARRPAMEWWDAFLASLVDIPGDLRAAVEAVAFTGVRGAVVGLDETGTALTPGYPDFDAEAVPHAMAIEQAFGDRFLARTGCPAFPLAGFAKLMMAGKVDGLAAFLGPQDYVAFRATGEQRLSIGTALRWGVLDAATLRYADDLLAELGIATEALPRLAKIGEPVGTISGTTAEATGIRKGTPVIAAPGDVPSAYRAATGASPGAVFVSLGTTTVAIGRAPDAAAPFAPFTWDSAGEGQRTIEYGTGAGGLTLEWLARLLGADVPALDSLGGRARSTRIAVTPEMVDPWGRGEGAEIRHLTPDDGPAELAARVFDAVAESALRSVEIVEAAAGHAERIVLGGGGASSVLIRAAFERRRPGAVTALPGRELAAEGAALVAARAVSARSGALVFGVPS